MISVIVPTFNRSQYIKKCLKSILSSTLANIEVIVIDDGSNDNTEEVVKNFNNKKIKYFYQNNSGIGYSRNHGLDLACGDFVVFVDSDDYIDNNMLENMQERMKKDKLDVLICDYSDFSCNGDIIRQIKIPTFDNTNLFNHPSLINEINLGPCNKMFRRNFLLENNIRFEENIKYEDVPFMISCLSAAKLIGKIDGYYNYFLDNSNGETRNIDMRIFDIFKVFELVKNKLNDNIYKDELSKLIVKKLTTYTISTRMIRDVKIRDKFIDDAFNYLKNNVSDYKKIKYYKEDKIVEFIIKRSKILTKIYCSMYVFLKK